MSDQEILNKRNIEALAEAQKRDRASLDEARIEIQRLKQQDAMKSQQLQRLEQQVAALMAGGYGRGGTAR